MNDVDVKVPHQSVENWLQNHSLNTAKTDFFLEVYVSNPPLPLPNIIWLYTTGEVIYSTTLICSTLAMKYLPMCIV